MGEQIPEGKADPQITRPSVIMRKNSSKVKKETQPSLSDIMTDCGIFKEFSEDLDDSKASIASPSSIHSEMEQNQELIDELEEFFIKADGKPTVVDETSEPISIPAPTSPDKILSALTTGNVLENNNTLTMEDLNNAYTTSLVSEDGQNVIIIIAPSSPAEFDSFLEPVSPKEFKDPLNSPIAASNDTDSSYDTDPDWSPSPASDTSFSTKILSPPQQTKLKKKYARSKPPQPPTGPYPIEKKERKKAQNRTAAFRYREKKKSEQDMSDEELEALEDKNIRLKEKLSEMETEFKYLKKLMVEAGLGKYTLAVNY